MTAEKQSRIHRIMVRAAIGAVIGGCTASAYVVLTAPDSKPYFDALAILGTGGLIGGAICGATIGAFGGKMGLAVAGVLGGTVGCVLIALGMLWYAARPGPAPKPYPGVEAKVLTAGIPWGNVRTQTFTVARSLDEMQQYYEKQMRRYCVDAWEFEELSGDAEFSLCRQTKCEIRRFWIYQAFDVKLCSVAETQTVVTQKDWWK